MGKINKDGSYQPEVHTFWVEVTEEIIADQTYELQKGVRSCCLIELDHIESLEEMLEIRDFAEWSCTHGKRKLHFNLYQADNELFIYTYSHEVKVYEIAQQIPCEEVPKEVKLMKEFMLGKLLKYSPEQMEEFLQQQGCL